MLEEEKTAQPNVPYISDVSSEEDFWNVELPVRWKQKDMSDQRPREFSFGKIVYIWDWSPDSTFWVNEMMDVEGTIHVGWAIKRKPIWEPGIILDAVLTKKIESEKFRVKETI